MSNGAPHHQSSSRLAQRIILVLCALVCACGTTQQKKELASLRSAVDKLQADALAQRTQLEDVNNRLTMLNSNLHALKQKSVADENAQIPLHLKTVQLVPDKQRQAPKEDAGDASGPAIDYNGPIDSPADDGGSDAAVTITDDGIVPASPRVDVAPLPKPPSWPSPKAAMDDSPELRSALDAFAAGHIKQAQGALKSYLERHPDNEKALFWSGLCAYELKDYAAAVRTFEVMTRKYPASPKAPEAWMKLGLSYEQLKKPREARGAYKELINQHKDSAFAELARRKTAQLMDIREAAPNASGRPSP